MLNLIRADLFKLMKSQAVKVLMGLTTASALISTVMAYLIPLGKIDTRMTGIEFMFSDMNVICILGAVIAGMIICGDFENKTIHNAISSGSRRYTIIVSKAAALAVALMMLLLPYAIVTAVGLGTGYTFDVGSVGIGFLHLLTAESGTVFGIPEIGKMAGIMLTLIIVYIAQLSLCVPLAFFLKKPVFVVAIYYGFSVLCAQLVGGSESSSVLSRIFSLTPYGSKHALMTLETTASDMAQTIGISIIFIAIMLTVTFTAFRKSEIK
ncbi:ABC transporter permease [Paenibacillus sp. GCM10012306]|uniref:ABC transporter permease n=1 Tax=Paenibacillus sp. GCM10012306 TaxID=3317342 RepID=UPI003621EC5D